MKNLLPWQAIGMNLAALGTAISFAKLIFLPHKNLSEAGGRRQEAEGRRQEAGGSIDRLNTKLEGTGGSGGTRSPVKLGFWVAMFILLGGLFVANIVYYEAYTIANVIKPLATIAVGWVAYFVIFKKIVVKLPRAIEKFEHLMGVMSLSLILLFWMALA
jgi:multicomponent Na+:H+ antiporter subunit D